MKSTLIRAGLVALMVGAIAGCGGGGGGDGGAAAPTPTPTPTPTGPTLTPAPVPTGTAPITVGTLTPTAFSGLGITGVVGGALVSSPPQISFALKDANNNPIIGFGGKSTRSTDPVPRYNNLAFSIAKLVPGTDGAPSKWVNYIVTTAASKNATTGAITDPIPTRPTTDNTGTLVDNGNGTYTYTFARDVTKIKDQVAAMTVSAPNDKADLGDLTFEPNLVHRITIQISGDAPGTGLNTPDGVQVTTGVPLKNAVNVIYDFIPATGKAVTATDPSRDIVAAAKCNECHGTLGGGPAESSTSSPARFHGGVRNDPRYCIVCHTDQRRYGRVEASFDTATNTFTKPATGCSASTSNPDPKCTYVVDGRTIGNFPNYIHKIHASEHLAKKDYDYAGVHFNHITYPQPITNCVKCHDGSDTSTAKTSNGNNWKEVPSRLACGACHDGINFSTGKGVTLADAREGKLTSQYGHIGGTQTTDKNCALCHSAADIPVYHVTVDPKLSDANFRAWYNGKAIPVASQLGTLPAGVYKINFEIKQATVENVTGGRKVTVVYRILKDGQPVTLNTAVGSDLITNVKQSPDIYIAYATAQDGVASPIDWNATKSLSVLRIRDEHCSGTKQTGPDSSGYYTATFGNTASTPAPCTNHILPADAKMVTAAMGISYTGLVQTGLTDYPDGIMLREPKFVMKTADGETARRTIVDADKCNACHGQLGVLPTFHGGARNNGAGCAICHDPNRSTGHVGRGNPTGTPVPTPYYYGGGWSVQSKNLIHGIHSASKRMQDFSYEASLENPGGFGHITYPGIVRRCETCHVAGGYDFSALTSAQMANLLWTTDTKGNMTNPGCSTSSGVTTCDTTYQTPIGQSPWVTGTKWSGKETPLKLGEGEVDYRTNHLVSSPIASSCFSCHDSVDAVQHMVSNGGTLVTQLSKASSELTRPAVGATSTMTWNKTELCMDCHKADSQYGLGIKAVHTK